VTCTFCYYSEQIADDIMSASKSLVLHSKDLVVTETKVGYLTQLTLDLDESETSTDLRYITSVTWQQSKV